MVKIWSVIAEIYLLLLLLFCLVVVDVVDNIDEVVVFVVVLSQKPSIKSLSKSDQ